VLPLAPLSNVTEAELSAVIQRMEDRITQEATAEEAGILWTATDVLMGLRYPRELVELLLRGVQGMKESVTYQAIVEEGAVRARQEDLLLIGVEKFGPPSEAIEQAIRSITDADRLTQLIRKSLRAANWEELLAVP
jgi:hypothetical protein